jgi:hypothetical protein
VDFKTDKEKIELYFLIIGYEENLLCQFEYRIQANSFNICVGGKLEPGFP